MSNPQAVKQPIVVKSANTPTKALIFFIFFNDYVFIVLFS